MLNSRSQASQDLFVIFMTKGKKKGAFLEIGANDAVAHSNTFLLEKEFQWSGLMVEFVPNFVAQYVAYRPNSKYIIQDATQVNYVEQMKDFPKNLDYLQIDLDVDNRSTLTTLENLNSDLFNDHKFATVTFEHDIYTGNYFDTQKASREIFSSRGYVLVFSNVKVFWLGDWKSFEDWYAHPDLVDANLLQQVKQDPENVDGINHNKCLEILKKYVNLE